LAPTDEAADPGAALAACKDQIHWVDLQQNFGPLHFQRIGLGYAEGRITAALDAAISLGPLEVSLDGLGAEYELASRRLRFLLQGMGVDFRRGALEIGGAFLRRGDEFAGKVTIHTGQLGIGAIGAYQEFRGHPSLFIYAHLDFPLGGPSFLFVEGLALGFGMNRRLTVPPVDQIAGFPLVSEVMGAASPVPSVRGGDRAEPSLGEELAVLDKYLTPEVGQYFVAAGIKFNSFRLVDSFALLAVSVGNHFEIDVFGISKLKVPSESPAVLAEIDMQFVARFSPDEGSLSVQAQLTPQSYILSPDCRLEGGFAFAVWMAGEHAGDFVYTLGGFHPHFQTPAHYPKVPRVGFNWQLNANTFIKGTCYYALTHSAAMAGGRLEASWKSGDLHAWFTLGADFLIAWKPFHYEASAYVEIGASLTIHFFGTHHVTISAGADLQIWGPEFAGHARVHVKVLMVKVNFTVELGHSSSSRPAKIGWEEFCQSFLTVSKGDRGAGESADFTARFEVIAVRPVRGLIRTIESEGKEYWIVNPKEFRFDVESTIPQKAEDDASFGIEPMGLAARGWTSTLNVNGVERFPREPIRKKVPSALWSKTAGPASRPDANAALIDAQVGWSLHPEPPPPPRAAGNVRDDAIQFTTLRNETYRPGPRGRLQHAADGDARWNAATLAHPGRAGVLRSLGFEPDDARLSDALAETFSVAPRIIEA
jgi:hypothetical protein